MERRRGIRISSLDGLRAVSIVFVLCGHLSGTTRFPTLSDFFTNALAGFGVRVFFVISGFLITSLLLHEHAETGTISLGHFYLRRTFRIFPPFYVYVAAVALCASLGWFELRRFDLLAALTYTTNYHQQRSWYLGHAWSLSVEEQFYLLWPFVMKRLGPVRASRVALGVVFAAPLWRGALLLFASRAVRLEWDEAFPTVADTLATGCLLACTQARIDGSARALRFLGGWTFWLVPAVTLVAAFQPSAKVDGLLGQTITNVGVALLIARMVRFPTGAVGRFLNARPVVFVGMLSYSLYLWQQPFLNRHAGGLVSSFPENLMLAVGFALLSYYLVERPALRLRARIEGAGARVLAVSRGVGE